MDKLILGCYTASLTRKYWYKFEIFQQDTHFEQCWEMSRKY